jgi:hypothetical protein
MPRLTKVRGQPTRRICELMFVSSDRVCGHGDGRVDNAKVTNGSMPRLLPTVMHRNVKASCDLYQLCLKGDSLAWGIKREHLSRSDLSKTIRQLSVKGCGMFRSCYVYHKEFSRRKNL